MSDWWVMIEAEHPEVHEHVVIGPFGSEAAAGAHLEHSLEVQGMVADDAIDAWVGDDRAVFTSVRAWADAKDNWGVYEPVPDEGHPLVEPTPVYAQAAVTDEGHPPVESTLVDAQAAAVLPSRGVVVLEVSRGLPEVLACPWVAGHVDTVDVGAWGPLAGGPGAAHTLDGPGAARVLAATCQDNGWQHGSLELSAVDWFDDQALTAAAPQAAWAAFCHDGTEQPGLWLGHCPIHGLVEAAHHDGDVMVPARWADGARRYGAEEQAVTRILAVLDDLAGTPSGRWNAGRLVDELSPAARRLATQQVLPGTPATAMWPPVAGHGRGLR